MKLTAFKKGLVRCGFLLTVFVSLFATTAKAGGDGYVIYLNDKMIVSRALHEPLDLKNIPITEENIGDKLVIKFTQCNMPNKIGKNRTITIRDMNGNVVKKWKFDDATANMVIDVKDLLTLQKQFDGTLSFFYSADGLHKTEKLAAVEGRKKSNG